MNIFLTAVGVTILLLVTYGAFSYGRQLEAEFRDRASAYAASCVQEYQNHVTMMYYATEPRQKWMASMYPPSVPSMPAQERQRRQPGDDPEFATRIHANGQATIMLGYNERNAS